MREHLITLAAGLLVGVIYGLLNVRSPAPPVIALIGLLGILLGEQIVPIAKRLLEGHPLTVSSVREACGHHVFGPLPHRRPAAMVSSSAPTEPSSSEHRI